MSPLCVRVLDPNLSSHHSQPTTTPPSNTRSQSVCLTSPHPTPNPPYQTLFPVHPLPTQHITPSNTNRSFITNQPPPSTPNSPHRTHPPSSVHPHPTPPTVHPIIPQSWGDSCALISHLLWTLQQVLASWSPIGPGPLPVA